MTVWIPRGIRVGFLGALVMTQMRNALTKTPMRSALVTGIAPILNNFSAAIDISIPGGKTSTVPNLETEEVTDYYGSFTKSNLFHLSQKCLAEVFPPGIVPNKKGALQRPYCISEIPKGQNPEISLMILLRRAPSWNTKHIFESFLCYTN